ncbi:MAG: hypothetical protein J6T31_01955 [Methanobrevibacter sp.]|nr:hypothetical protein [Methanobrevibacter sp.]
MKFTQLEIRVVGNEIAITQENFDEDMGVSEDEIRITPEMVDSVCVELQKLKAQILSENQEKK